jgi:hypothetical protein
MDQLPETRRYYCFPCPCGGRVDVQAAQAGVSLKCPQCRRTTVVPALSELRRYPWTTRSKPHTLERQKPIQIGLRHIFLFMVPCGMLCAVVYYLGFGFTLALICAAVGYVALAWGLGTVAHFLPKAVCAFWDRFAPPGNEVHRW